VRVIYRKVRYTEAQSTDCSRDSTERVCLHWSCWHAARSDHPAPTLTCAKPRKKSCSGEYWVRPGSSCSSGILSRYLRYARKASWSPPLSAMFSPCVLIPFTCKITHISVWADCCSVQRLSIAVTHREVVTQLRHTVLTVLLHNTLDPSLVLTHRRLSPPLLQVPFLVVPPTCSSTSCYTMLHHATSCYIMLHHATTCYTMLHHATPCYIMLHHVTPCYIMLHHVTSCYTMLHHVTLCYIMLHHVTSCYTMLHHVTLCYIMLHYVTSCYIMLYHVTSCCTMLHHVAPCYIMLHHQLSKQ
jgi:hypothetical protein